MSDDATPAKVRLTDGLGPLPEPAAETVMDLCADHEGPVEAWQYLPADAMLYTANQMRDYAAQEVGAALERVIAERDKLRAWAEEAVSYVGCETWSPSLKEEGEALLLALGPNVANNRIPTAPQD